MASDKIYKIINARILLNHEIVKDSYLWYQDGKIIHPQNLFFSARRDADEIIDAKGLLVVPGFIETQINGAYGIDFADHEEPTEVLKENINKVAKGLLKRAGSASTGATILGAHIEGPFIALEKKGAHKPEVLKSARNGIRDLDEAYGSQLKKGREAVSIITMAPEIEGICDAIPDLVERGIVVSMGHSACKIADAEKAVTKGANSITHLFNAMPAFHHRDPGLIGILGAADLPIPDTSSRHPEASETSPDRQRPDPRPFYGLICDGVHVHPNSIRIAYYSHPTGAVLVTDTLSAMGLPKGDYILGGSEVEVDENGGAYIKGTKTLAGSTITIDQCIRNFQKFTNCSLVEAIEAATLHPARMLGIDRQKGTLDVGADADFVFLNDANGDISVERVFIAGEEVQL
ncbi:hypothetical protein G6F46_008176 [Rhizopus delemar]|uniref:N-acetylglucosamine-6-phosphate deacetylase n=3 Tax=Rhizopus TaxID=4842 RepID=I1CD54_RHIO9|nr:hypothetical protein RO3G_11095 [Rhizopus delemar RA 99-880]KAG1494799.1 hypothetical protein G6F54_007616 [Rhizopus delemar]KAG1540604.1 hypothetical protein G6F51_008421 [Rhizopus arrhizus]KAG1508889.1 hypothetical protein G6F53_007854 [Rhizopus delemar]KAG1567677.1 hypothetical protein G6F50_007985 [Rhizopus delemar]|eukprot:EIE86384.1 hypothetical protein RO3G_11095 [Rhizopus delemar RA 99-880]